ncbi:MAG: hypothetical protein Kow0031_38220 [Anaerolineae bacterium]
MIRVLVVEDSPTIRELIINALGLDPALLLADVAGNGREAVDRVKELRPDLITMDIEMPDMDGITATRHIMAQSPTPILIVTSHLNSKHLNVAFEAIKAGALDVMGKPNGSDHDEYRRWQEELIAKIKTLATVRPQVIPKAD